VKLVALFAVAACGRIDFTPIHSSSGDDDDDGPIDGAKHVDAALDGVSNACATATLMVQVGVSLPVNTCVDPDLLDGCGPPNTKEALVEFIPPASTGYNARAYDHGTLNITMVSIKLLDDTCVASVNGCSAILGTTYTQDVPAYFVLEASSGGCADVDLLVD
jgi:hypothetical protein